MTTIFHASEGLEASPIIPVWNLSRNSLAHIIMNFNFYTSSSVDKEKLETKFWCICCRFVRNLMVWRPLVGVLAVLLLPNSRPHPRFDNSCIGIHSAASLSRDGCVHEAGPLSVLCPGFPFVFLALLHHLIQIKSPALLHDIYVTLPEKSEKGRHHHLSPYW